jgi:SAM-dependent methyltransferase
MTVDAPTVSARVRRQYEYLPYPHRDPQEERQRLLITGLDDLNAVNHYCYRGRRNFHAGFRALIAGGGTGDSVVFLAEQLRHTRAELVYIDLSEASQAVCRRRLQMRGLEQRVHWIHGSLLDLPTMGLGKFDFINCSGVLHHLASPPAGLAALRAVLKDDGALALMVYGQYGRTGVYQLQSLFRLIGDPTRDLGDQVAEVRGLTTSLPPCNWYQRGADLFASTATVSDSEILDLFLHSQDRAYTVPELYEFLAGSGLHLTQWSSESRIWYQPSIAFQNLELLERIERLPRPVQEAACELFWGTLNKHALWATPQAETILTWDDADVVPTWTRAAGVFACRERITKEPGPEWGIDFVKTGGTKMRLRIVVDDVTRRFVELADGYRSKGTILEQLAREFPEKTAEQLHAECAETFRLLNTHDLLVLRHREVSFIPN